MKNCPAANYKLQVQIRAQNRDDKKPKAHTIRRRMINTPQQRCCCDK